MHTFGDSNAGVPAFLAKLWRLVDDPETNNLICWSKDGRSFIIQNQAQFARELLPQNYKHNNMASFIRQLNMYGFHKITSIDNGGLKFDRDEMEFSHPYFQRNCPHLLEHIKRKIANTKNNDEKSPFKGETVTKVLQDVKSMRVRQESLDSRFSIMKQENEALWREIASLRQKHAKQQQIVNKLIQFLITIVQPSRNMSGVKRHMQLMINDTPENENVRKASESESECGPVIHELGEELLDEVSEVDPDLMNPISPYARTTGMTKDNGTPSPLNVERPQSSISVGSQNYDFSNQSIEDALNAGNANIMGNISNQRNIAGAKSSSGGAVVQTVNPDGVEIVYHVTEMPDAHPNEAEASPMRSKTPYSEENVLTTPMVREQMARSQMLKQKNKERRQQSESDLKSVASKSIKIEPDIDPMLFLNTYDDNRGMTPDPRLISPNLSEDSTQSFNANNTLNNSSLSPCPGANGNGASTSSGTVQNAQPGNMYNAGDFITDSMPVDLFDDASILSNNGDNNSNFNENYKHNEQQQQTQQEQQQQQFGRSTANNGKFSSFIAGNNSKNGNGNNNGKTNTDNANKICASTSAQAATLPSTSAAAAGRASGGKNMAVTKFKNESDEPVKRLSTADDVHGHLDNVQDELESLKELLRNDGYTFDANTLMSLFNDSDVLGPYGMNLYNDLPNNTNNNDGKRSELMTYQPSYDLSDILDKSDLEADNDDMNSPSERRQVNASAPSLNSSSLNTPYHE